MKHRLAPARLPQYLLVIACVLPVLNSPNSALAESPGVKIGGAAPAFSLKDQTGTELTLDSLLEQGNVALVFYRSADW